MLPEWLDRDAWDGFKLMRKQQKKPMTERAERMILRKLENFREWGEDPNAILDQSTLKCWLDVYGQNEKQYPKSGVAHLSADDIAHYKKLGLLQ